MVVRNESQALCVAVEMEKRAVRVYERALMLAENCAVSKGIKEILKDEQEHLKRFSQMREGCACDPQEDRVLIQAMGADVLFSGGVMEMERAKALATLKGLYEFAIDSEYDAMKKYAEFADKCENQSIREAFLAIASEEASHYAELQRKLNELDGE